MLSQTIKILVNKQLLIYLIIPILLWVIPLSIIEGSPSICLFKNLFGINCLGCGMTRAVFNVLHGNFYTTFEYNSLVIAVFPLLVYLWFKKVINLLKKYPFPAKTLLPLLRF